MLRAETERIGAVYRAYPITAVDLVALSAIDQPLGHWTPVRRWPRIRPVSEVGVQIPRSGTRITDLSYGGIRFAVSPDPGHGAAGQLRTAAVDPRHVDCRRDGVGDTRHALGGRLVRRRSLPP